MAAEKTEAVRPFLKYVGGKTRMLRHILPRLPAHHCYVEPFGGMGAVLLAKPRSKVEVWNDIHGGLANLMRCVKHHPQALADELDWMLVHRSERKHWARDQDAPGLTDLQRAARFVMARHSGFGGGSGKGFHVGRKGCGIKPVTTLIEQMRLVARRLSGVSIEHLPWQRVLALYDGPETVFYLDPPYADGDQGLYPDTLDEAGHRELASALLGGGAARALAAELRRRAAGARAVCRLRHYRGGTRAHHQSGGCTRLHRAAH